MARPHAQVRLWGILCDAALTSQPDCPIATRACAHKMCMTTNVICEQLHLIGAAPKCWVRGLGHAITDLYEHACNGF